MYRVNCVPGISWSVPLTAAFALAMMMMTSCGQDPAFTEEAATTHDKIIVNPDGSVSGPGDSVVANQAPPTTPNTATPAAVVTSTGANKATEGSDSGMSTGGGNGQYPTVPGPFQPMNVLPPTGTELPSSLRYVHDISSLKTISKVDILWVVDSSGSMSEEQSYLGTNFLSFIGSLGASNSDFQVGVTTTDICASQSPSTIAMSDRWCPTLDGSSSTHLRGSLVGSSGNKVLKPMTSNLNSKFTQYAHVGINGSSFEHGLKAAEMAVSKSIAGQNEGLVRSDAFLAVIVVSDEEDDGIGLGKTDLFTGINYIDAGLTSARYTDENFISYLNTNKGTGMFSVSAITGTRLANGRMCTSPHSQPQEEGSQYIAAARKTGGIIQSICDTNWSASLTNIGRDINAQSSLIILSQVPYAGTIRIYVNGVENTNWTYTSASNSIKFNAGQVPATGSTIDIAYWHEG